MEDSLQGLKVVSLGKYGRKLVGFVVRRGVRCLRIVY